jgi:serine/threonine-protein kinase
LLVEVPREMPPAARAEREALLDTERAEGARFMFMVFIAYFAAAPLAVLVGIRSWLIVAVSFIVGTVGAVSSRWMQKRRAVKSKHFMFLLGLSVLVVFIQSTWLGPFVLTPMSAAVGMTVSTIYARRSERWMVVVAGLCMFLVPFLADLLGLVPPGFSFEPGRVVLHERALGLPKVPTLIALGYTCLAYILLPVALLGRVRDTTRALEDRLFLQGWHLRRVFPGAAT